MYTRSLQTGWKPPLAARRMDEGEAQALRDRFHIIVEGENLLPPMLDFAAMRFPPGVLRQLAAKGIRKPTPIQMQAGAPASHASGSLLSAASLPAGHCMPLC